MIIGNNRSHISKMIYIVLTAFLCAICPCHTANILAIIPTSSFSHQVAFTELWKELSLRGHQVTVATTDPRNDPNLENLTEIDMSRSYKVWNEKFRFSEKAQKGMAVWNVWEFFLYMLSEVLEDQLTLPEFQLLINESEKFKFDIVMIEVFYPELLIFGKLYNCPTALMGTIGSTTEMYNYLGNNAHPALVSDLNLPIVGKFTFMERVLSTLFHWHHMYFEYSVWIPRKQQIIDKFFKKFAKTTVGELISERVDLLLINENPFFKGMYALGPTTINVGGVNRLEPLKPLNKVNLA